MDPRSLTRLVTAALPVAAALTFAPATAHALSCGGRLVEVGDNAAYVRGICGEASYASQHQEMRSMYGAAYGGYGYYGSRVATTVQVDVWVYDFGPTRFIEELTFENGVLRSERIAGYGTTAGGRARREARRAERTGRHRDED